MPAAIVVDNVSKKFLIGSARYSSLRDVIARPVRRLLGRAAQSDTERTREFWALKDVSFEVEKGTTLGIIGPNGAGKSTLLKLLSRVSIPTSGKITTHGRVSALIEVGAGFHPELTGRENVYLNGSILGMTKKEIDKKFDAIVDFSGIEQFIDTPVKYYSSGMYVRLGFSVAVHMEPDVLLIDEILSVGDAAFQQKCHQKLASFREKGATLIIVSHNVVEIVRQCSRAVLLLAGNVTAMGGPDEVVRAYCQQAPLPDGKSSQRHLSQPETAPRPVTRCIERVSVIGVDRKETRLVGFGDPASFRFELNLSAVPSGAVLGFRLRRNDGLEISGWNTKMDNVSLPATSDNKVAVEYQIAKLLLAPGQYVLAAELVGSDVDVSYDVCPVACKFEIIRLTEEFGVGISGLGGRFCIERGA